MIDSVSKINVGIEVTTKIEEAKKGIYKLENQLKAAKKEAKDLEKQLNALNSLDTENPSVKKNVANLSKQLEQAFSKQLDLKAKLKFDTAELNKLYKEQQSSTDTGVEELKPSLDGVRASVDNAINTIGDVTSNGWLNPESVGDVKNNLETAFSGVLQSIEYTTRLEGGPQEQQAFADVGYQFREMLKNFVEDCQDVANKVKKPIEEIEQSALRSIFNIKSAASSHENGSSGGDKSSSSGSGLGKAALTIGKAMLGVRGLYMLIRKIVSQNEKLQSALQTVFTTLANVLEPVLNFVASILNGVSTELSKILKVSTVNKNANEKTANNTAGFDELNVISPESSSSTINPEDDKSAGALIGQGLADIIVGLLEIILGAVELVAGIIGAIIYGIAVIVEGAVVVLGVMILAVVTILTIAFDLFMIIVSAIVGFFVAIKEGFIAFVDALVNGEGFGAALKAFMDKFSEAFSVIMKFVDDKIVKPSGDVLQKMWKGIIDVLINPAIDGLNAVCSGFAKCINLCIRGIEWIANGFVDVVNGIVAIINAIPGVNIGYLNRVSMKRMSENARIPKLNTGTNYVETEGLAYLHEGEAVVPKKYNPAADGVGNREVVDALYTILDALNEKDMSITIGDDVIGRANNRYNTRIGKTIISGSFADVY